MNWVSSSLELAGSLLESVDQQAALTLAGSEEEEQTTELVTSQTSGINTVANVTTEEREKSTAEETPILTHDSSSSSNSSPSKTTLTGHSKSTPSRVNSRNNLAGLVSAISTQMEHVSSGRGGGIPVGSSSSHLVLAGNDCTGLQKELAQVQNELKVKEKQLSNTQKRMQTCEEELLALEQECSVKISQVQHEKSVIQQERNLDEMKFIQALEMKDEQMRATKADMEELIEANTRHTDEIALLKAELAKAVESKDTLWTTAASASNESEQLIESLRSELQETLTAMKNLKREHAESKTIMYSRQVQLENTNTELVNNVANLERELAKAREAAAQYKVVTKNATSDTARLILSDGSMADDYRRAQQTLVLTKKSLQDEIKKNELQKHEITALTEEVRRLKSDVKTAEECNVQKLDVMSQENEKLNEEVKKLSSHESATAAANGELRIQRLTNRLIEKQETIDLLRNRLTTMDIRLQDVTLRAQRAEEKLARMEQNGGVDDLEMATIVGKSGIHAVRSRPNRMVHMIARVAPVVERSHRVVTVLNLLDRWLLFLGRVFLQAPLARLGMLCYILLIQCWVFMILSFHTSHLTEEIQLSENVVNEPKVPLI